MENVNKVVKDIESGNSKYFCVGAFHASNMADYTLMSATIGDLVDCYDIDEVEAGEVVQALIHS